MKMKNIQPNKSLILVRFTAEGFHCWPEANGARSYLANRHRHLFHVEVETAVTHDNREIELHDLLDDSRRSFGGGNFGSASCESLARGLATALAGKYDRTFRVGVFEDGEVGASVTVESTN
jgi:hypothetical protein